MNEITMPRLSDSMQEGTILAWLKQNGDRVQLGDELVEIETDKAAMTYHAESSGVLEITVPEGTNVPVGAAIGRLGDAAALPSERTDPRVQRSEAVVEAAIAPAVAPAGQSSDPAASGAGNGHPARTAIKATPLARRLAEAHGLSLQDVAGSGPRGRVTRCDVLARAGVSSVPSGPAPTAASPAKTITGDVKVVELTRAQAVLARVMAHSKATVPEFQVQTDVIMDEAIAFRAQIEETGLEVPSLNDLVVKAAALALRRHARANGSYRDGRLELYSRVNIGIAVAGEGLLVVPTVFDADQKSLGAIATESRRLAERARAGKITPPELSGATFTVSNLGMYGMTAITPVINAPQAAILGVGAMRPVLARADGELVDRHLMTLTLSCDHRILNGADAAQFLSDLRDLLEQPLRLALKI